MKMYALIDASNAPNFLEMLDTYDPPASCLFNEPLQAGMADKAPYLVELTKPVKAWLAQLTTPWGLYLITTANFLAMRKHLRRYTFALIPIEKKPVFFRFYDPRVFWDLTTKILDDWQLHAFLGPIEIVASYCDGHYQQEHFEARRAQFPDQIRMKTQYLTLTAGQYRAFEQIYEERYIEELAAHMMRYVDPSIIEEAEHNAERVHREMLEHARDVQGAEITHPADQAMLLTPAKRTESTKAVLSDEKTHQTTIGDKPFFHFVRHTGQWRKITGSKIERVEFAISQALTRLARTPMSEATFHELTHYEYHYLSHQLKPEDKGSVPVADGFDPYRTDAVRAYNEEAYFYYQQSTWYYVDEERYAHPIDDERVEALVQIGQPKIFEAVFHHRTNNRYKHHRDSQDYHEGEAIISSPEPMEEEPFEITTMDELREAIDQFARDLYYFCHEQEISDNRSIKGLAQIMIQENCFRLIDIHDDWISQLTDSKDPGYFRAESLIYEVLGEVPLYR